MSVLDLTDAKAYLNIVGDASDTELTAFIAAAEAAVAQEVGPLSTSTVTKRVPGYAWNLYLPVYPAVSLTSVTVVGSATTLTVSDLYLDKDSGQVSYNGGSFFGASAYDVTYVAGRASMPADLLMAVRKMLRVMWVDQRRPSSKQGGEDAVQFSAQVGSLPSDVLMLTRPYRLQTLGA